MRFSSSLPAASTSSGRTKEGWIYVIFSWIVCFCRRRRRDRLPGMAMEFSADNFSPMFPCFVSHVDHCRLFGRRSKGDFIGGDDAADHLMDEKELNMTVMSRMTNAVLETHPPRHIVQLVEVDQRGNRRSAPLDAPGRPARDLSGRDREGLLLEDA